MLFCSESVLNNAHTKKKKCRKNDTFLWSPRDGTRTPKIIVLRDYVVLRIAV